MQATTGDLALGLARLEGKLDGLTQTTGLQLNAFGAMLADSKEDRRDLHRENDVLRAEIEKLKQWRSWLTGIGSASSLLALYTTLHQAHVI